MSRRLTRAYVCACRGARQSYVVVDLVGFLRAAGGVEELEALLQRRESIPDRADVKGVAERLGHRRIPPKRRRGCRPGFDRLTNVTESQIRSLAQVCRAMV